MKNSLAMEIADVPLFDALGFDELAVVEPYLLFREFKAGASIYKQGEHGSSVCFVVEGELDVIRLDGPGKEVKVATLGKGQAVGEMAIIDGLTRSASIRAGSAGSILILKRDDFNRIVDDHPQIGIKILKGLARMLSSNLRETSEVVTKMMMAL